MKSYTFFTPSHQVLVDNFLSASVPSDLELIYQPGSQTCESGNFMSEGWNTTMLEKVDRILDAIEDTWGDAFFFVDADIQFFGPVSHLLSKSLENHDIVAQDDSRHWKEVGSVLCAGMLACQSNAATRKFWQNVKRVMIRHPHVNDQTAMNHVRRRGAVRFGMLPRDLFWSPRTPWNAGDPLIPPSRILVHHANFTVGVEQKIAQLSSVKQIVETRKGIEYHGSNYGGYSVLGGRLGPKSVVYSVGIGEDATFDVSLIEKFGVTVHAFDPTPKSVVWVEKNMKEQKRFHFSAFGILDRNERIEHFKPMDPKHVSCSRYPISGASVSLPMRRLKDVMAERSHIKIDLLKLDIEGAECDVIDDMLQSNILPSQLLVEFHTNLLPKSRIKQTLAKLRAAGYQRFAKQQQDFSFALNLSAE